MAVFRPTWAKKQAADVRADEAVLGLLLESRGDGKRMAHLPAVPAVDDRLLSMLESCDLVLFDGTFWTDDELVRVQGGGERDGDYPWLQAGLGYFEARLSQAPEDARFAFQWMCEHARTREDQELAARALIRKCDILWTQLDALYFAYVAPGWHTPGAFRPQ